MGTPIRYPKPPFVQIKQNSLEKRGRAFARARAPCASEIPRPNFFFAHLFPPNPPSQTPTGRKPDDLRKAHRLTVEGADWAPGAQRGRAPSPEAVRQPALGGGASSARRARRCTGRAARQQTTHSTTGAPSHGRQPLEGRPVLGARVVG